MATLGPQAGAFFQASTFLQFDRDGAGAISLPRYVQYLSQHANALQLVNALGSASLCLPAARSLASCLAGAQAWRLVHARITLPPPPPHTHTQRGQLCFYDEEGTGELSGAQLERYLADGGAFGRGAAAFLRKGRA
jgi:hypothetical protein